MNDLTRLRELRSEVPQPSPEAWANARSALDRAVLEERDTRVPSPLRIRGRAADRPGPRLVVSPVLAAAVVVLVVVLVVALGVGVPTGHDQSATRGQRGLVHLTWKLVGDLSSSWKISSGLGYQPGVFLSCPAAGTCYASVLTEGPPGTFSVSYNEFEVTHDSGNTWHQSNLPVTLSAAAPLSCVGADICATLGIDGSGHSDFFKTTDGGESWVTVAGPSQLSSAIGIARLSCTSAAACVAVVKGPKGSTGTAVAFRTSNGGGTWAESPLPAGFIPLTLQCFSSGACITAGLSESSQRNVAAVLYSTDGGATWAPGSVPSGLQSAGSLSCADRSDCLAGSIVENQPESHMLSSTDGGASWTLAGTTGLPSGNFIVTGLSCPGTTDCWLAGFALSGDSGARGFLASTTDSGETWQQAQLPQGIAVVRDVRCPTSTRCYALAIQRSVPPGSARVVLLAYAS
jgi:photosystem II stability/assembly factor-like uncharacterized protein